MRAAHGDRSVGREWDSLTARQLEVVALVTRGFANKEIAAHLGVTRRAVEALLTRIFERLRVDNRTALMARAMSEAGFGPVRVRPGGSPSGTRYRDSEGSVDDATAAYVDARFLVAITHGPEHRYTFVNRAAAQVAGRPVQDLVGRSLRELYPDIDPLFVAALDACYRRGCPQVLSGSPARWIGADGSFRDRQIDLLLQPLRDRSGAVVGLLHIGNESEPPGK